MLERNWARENSLITHGTQEGLSWFLSYNHWEEEGSPLQKVAVRIPKVGLATGLVFSFTRPEDNLIYWEAEGSFQTQPASGRGGKNNFALVTPALFSGSIQKVSASSGLFRATITDLSGNILFELTDSVSDPKNHIAGKKGALYLRPGKENLIHVRK